MEDHEEYRDHDADKETYPGSGNEPLDPTFTPETENPESEPKPKGELPKLTDHVIYVDADGNEFAGTVSKVDGDTIGIHVLDPHIGGTARFVDGVEYGSEDELNTWHWPS